MDPDYTRPFEDQEPYDTRMDDEEGWEEKQRKRQHAEDYKFEEEYDEYEHSDTHVMGLLNLANHHNLEDYWKHGKGAVKIRWGTPGDWTRCYRHIKKYVNDEYAKRICAQWHKDTTGVYPGDRRNPGNRK